MSDLINISDNNLVELTDAGAQKVKNSPLWSPDLAALPIKARTWGSYNYFSLWIGIVFCVPTLLLTGGMIPNLAWWQAMLAIAVGSFLMGILQYLNGHAGSKYGIPMGVVARASWGTKGTLLASFIRSTVAMGYAGIETYIGGSAVDGLFLSMFPGWVNVGGHLAISVIIFTIIELFLIWYSPPTKEMKGYKVLSEVALPGMLIIGVVLVAALYARVGSWGPLFGQPAALEGRAWLAFFASCGIAAFGYWGESMTHYPDLSRYSKTPREQGIGSIAGVTFGMIMFGMIGVSSASFGKALFGETIWNPVDIIAQLGIKWLSFLALIFICLVTLTTNMGANLTPSGFFFTNLFPKHIHWRIGATISLAIGMALRPWVLLANFGSFLFDWLLLWMCWIAPLGGIMIADYWLVRNRELDLAELYNPDGIYKYSNGYNPYALGAWAVGTVLSLLNKNYSFIVGLPVAAILYYWFMKSWGLKRYQPAVLDKGKQ
jgi:NCS1 family nucleobase:cation symporter-1